MVTARKIILLPQQEKLREKLEKQRLPRKAEASTKFCDRKHRLRSNPDLLEIA